MSICVVGVPLPGWKLSAVRTTKSWLSISRMLPLRTELAMTLTGGIPLDLNERGEGLSPRDFDRNILILRAEASIFPADVNMARRP